ncbi:hypothetical protein TNCT_155841 [Trichonephila clavata]|uniref:Uncharacterized protein n=1 Tax=Trichonephila clavata TaxID=2740835 RepID=A0A8X6IDT0_TRICU|nr:hypothetical protein TNCT_155841 [Trichonephila clavata]
MQDIASRINLEEEAEKFYIIKGLKECRAIEMQLKSSKDVQELREKMKILDIQESKISTTNRQNLPIQNIPWKIHLTIRPNLENGTQYR